MSQLLPSFQRADTLLGTSLYSDPLCLLTGPLQRGSLNLLYGSPVSNAIALRLCLTAQLPVDNGGLASKSVVVDAGNAFDLYYFTSLARENRIEPAVAMDRLLISRSFNCHQLAGVLTRDLPGTMKGSGAKVVSVLEVGACFDDLPEREKERMWDVVGDALADVAYETQSVVAVTSANLNDVHARRALFSRANVAVRFQGGVGRGSRALTMTLVKHPFGVQKSLALGRDG